MAYTLQTWVDGTAGNTPLNATRLGHMESGIAAAYGQIGTGAPPAASTTNQGTWWFDSAAVVWYYSDGAAWHSFGVPASPSSTTPAAETFGAAGAVGTAVPYARGDHVHPMPATPATSVFGRTGAVVAASGDYTAAQVTNAADKSSASAQTFSGPVVSTQVNAVLGGQGAAGAAGCYAQLAGDATWAYVSAKGTPANINMMLATTGTGQIVTNTNGVSRNTLDDGAGNMTVVSIAVSSQGTATSSTGGAASALPALPVGYLVVNINGTSRKIPYYAT